MCNGWTSRTAQELDPTIRVWHEMFAAHRIPPTAYDRLYRRAFDARAGALQAGKEPPPLSAELIVAQWTGPNGVRAELEQELVSAGRTLSENAASQCPYCKGSGFREVRDQQGRVIGVKRGCDHRD